MAAKKSGAKKTTSRKSKKHASHKRDKADSGRHIDASAPDRVAIMETLDDAVGIVLEKLKENDSWRIAFDRSIG